MTNTHIKPFVCILLAILLLTGCAGKNEIPIVELKSSQPPALTPTLAPSAEPVPTPTRTPMPFVESTPFIPWTEKIDEKMQLTETHELTLRCNVRYAEHGMDGVNQIEVLDGDTCIQTLKINEAINRVYGVEHHDENYYGLPDFEIMDINFDGFNDFGMFLDAGNVNENWLYWIWDEESESFRFSCRLHGYDIQTDEARERIVCYSRDGQGIYDTHEYAWLDEEQPTLVYWLRSKTEHPLHFIQVYLTHHELIDGEMKVTKCVVGEERIDEYDDRGSYVLEKDIKIDEHNALTLRFYGQHSVQLEWIDVMDHDRVLYQTITFDEVGRYSIVDVPSRDGNIQIADHNNDGHNDFSLEIEKDYPETGYLRHWWLWNPKTSQFDYEGSAE